MRKKKIITSYLENVIFGNKNYTEHESNVDKNKNLSIKEYLDKIKPCFKDIINDLRKIWCTENSITIAIKFSFSKNINEKHVMHLESGNLEVMAYDKEGKFIEELFESFLCRHPVGSKTSTKGSDFIFDFVYLLHYKSYKIQF